MRFTIVTPSLNQLDWLKLCVASVADQELGPDVSVEHIIQDGGTCGIEEFAREMGAEFYQDGKKVFSAKCALKGRLSDAYSLTIHRENDEGMYDAIGNGLRRASGDLCAYLNCDEQYLPDTLRWVSGYFSESPCIDVLYGAAIVTKNDGGYVCDRRVTVPQRWHTMVSGNLSIFTSSTFFRRESVVSRGLLFDPSWRVCGDAEWALRLRAARLRMRTTKLPLSAFAETGRNLSAAGNPQAASELNRLAQAAPLIVRMLKPLILFSYRAKRWVSGAYALEPHSYAVYTKKEFGTRKRFDVPKPTFRWRLGAP